MRHCLLLLATLSVAAAAAPEPEREIASALRGDRRLEAPVTLAVKDEPLGEVLGQLSKRVGVKLTASRETRDDRVTLFVDKRPANALISQVAEHMGFTWLRAGGGYELAQSLASRRREHEKRLADLAPIRAEMDRVAALVKEPRKALLDRVKELDARIKAGQDPPEQAAALKREKQLLLNVALAHEGLPQMTLDFFRALSDPQVVLLLDREQLRLSTANHTLSADRAKQIEEAVQPIDGPSPQRQADVVIWLAEGDGIHDFGPQPRRDRAFWLNFAYVSLRGTPNRPFSIVPRWKAGGLEPAAPQSEPADAFLKRTVDLKLPGPEMSPPAFPSPSPREGRRSLEYVWPAWPTLGDLAEALHREGIEVAADSFVSARFEPSRLRGRRTLAEVREFLEKELDYTWRREGNLLFLRSRHYYRDRPAEVPERIVRPWRARVEVKRAPSLDDLAELAGALTNPQARSMQDYWGWYFRGAGIAPPDWFYGNRHHLRFWNGLTPAQREAARREIVPVSALSPVQRQAWSAGFFAPPVTVVTSVDLRRTPTEEELAAGGFRLEMQDLQEQLFVNVGPDGKTRHGSSIVAPAGRDIARLHQPSEGGPSPDGPPTPLTGYQFRYYLAGEMKPARSVDVSVARPR